MRGRPVTRLIVRRMAEIWRPRRIAATLEFVDFCHEPDLSCPSRRTFVWNELTTLATYRPVRSPLWSWPSTQPDAGYSVRFENGVGVDLGQMFDCRLYSLHAVELIAMLTRYCVPAIRWISHASFPWPSSVVTMAMSGLGYHS